MSLSDTIKDNIETLRLALVVFENLTDDQYTQVLTPYFNASVGKHFRHILDHYFCFFAGIDQGHIDYDDRERDAKIETKRLYTLEKIHQLISRLDELKQRFASSKIRVATYPLQVSLASSANNAVIKPTASSLGRELIFLEGHTTHHYAIISAQLKLMACPISENFGVAASTQIYNQQTSCVP